MSVTAIWRGPFTAEVNGQLVEPGDQVEISDEDMASSHFDVVNPSTPTPTVTTPSTPAASFGTAE